MISQKVKDYILEHSFCPEYLFKDWDCFLKLLYAEGEQINSIFWWDYCKKEEHKLSVGSGGYIDPEDSEYIYVETQLYEEGLEAKTLDEIMEYITSVRENGLQYDNKYVSHELVPSFFLKSDKSQFIEID